jgi:hypothetical protein
MHENFARWYGTVSLGDDVARRQDRWRGVINVITDAQPATVEALLRLAYGTRAAPVPADLQAIRQCFKDVDETFEMSGNERELQVLAAASLSVLMEDLNANEGSRAALAVTTAALGGARKPDLPMDLAALGEAAIVRHSNASRKRPSLDSYIDSASPKLDFDKAAAKVRQQADANGLAEAFSLAADAASAAIGTVAKRQANAMDAVDKFIRAQDEELQMLWWLMGQRSEKYDCPFDAVPVDTQPIVFATELADSTQIMPGPRSVKAMLSRAGLRERKKVALTAAVNAARPELLRGLLADSAPSPVSAPLHFAIQRQLETGPGDAWVAGWAATTGVNASHAVSGLTLGELFYRERLLFLFE